MDAMSLSSDSFQRQTSLLSDASQRRASLLDVLSRAASAEHSELCVCGNTVLPDSRFCRRCGQQFTEQTQSNSSPEESLPAVEIINIADDAEEAEEIDVCVCGDIFMPDAVFCRKCGARRAEGHRDKMIDLMLRIDVFDGIPREELSTLAASFKSRIFQDGQAIVRQGELGHELFFIQEGNVSVRVKTGDDSPEIEVGTLRYGQYFGEASLLTSAPRNASVYASGGVVMVSVLSKEQFEQLGLTSKLDLEIKYAELSNGLSKAVFSFASMKSSAKFLLALGFYIAVSIIVFRSFEGWNVTDSVYFAIITLLTIGYGDITPQHQISRLVVVIFVITGLVIVAVIIGDFLENLVTAEIKNEKARKALRLHQPRVGVFDRTGQKRREYSKLWRCLLAVLALIAVQMVAAKCFMNGAPDFIDGLYFAIITLSTIGYGDIAPHHDAGKWVISFLSLFGVPLFAMLLGRIVEIAYGKARNEQLHTVVGGLTLEKYEHLVEFTDAMALAGAYNSKPRESRRHEITPFEFLCFILVKNETITLDEIKSIMANFTELDIHRKGFLDPENLEEWQRRGATNPVGLVPSPRSTTSYAVSTSEGSSLASSSLTPLASQ